MKYVHVFTFLIVFIIFTACNGQVKKESPTEKADHPKLIKTQGNPRYGNVQCALQDKAGNLWFGTTDNGLYKYDGKSFTQFLETDGLISNNITALLEDINGKIWIGTPLGLCLHDPALTTSGKSFTMIEIPVRKDLPPNKNHQDRNAHYVFSIMQARNGKLWFATIDGVYIYNGKSFTPFVITEAAGGYMSTNNNAEYMLEDKKGNIWFGGRGTEGLYRYDGKSVVNIKLKEMFQNDGPKPKAHTWAWPQVQDKNGDIWFSNWGGVYRYDGKSFTTFTEKDGLSGDMVSRITEDKKGDLWFGGAGLSRYDGKSFNRFTPEDGLPSLGVWVILEDKARNIWVGTRETGLYLYQGKKFIKYSGYKD